MTTSTATASIALQPRAAPRGIRPSATASALAFMERDARQVIAADGPLDIPLPSWRPLRDLASRRRAVLARLIVEHAQPADANAGTGIEIEYSYPWLY